MFQLLEETMGYLPNNMLSMAHWPELLKAVGGIGATILQQGRVDRGLKQLVAMVASLRMVVITARRIPRTLHIILVFPAKKSKLYSSLSLPIYFPMRSVLH